MDSVQQIYVTNQTPLSQTFRAWLLRGDWRAPVWRRSHDVSTWLWHTMKCSSQPNPWMNQRSVRAIPRSRLQRVWRYQVVKIQPIVFKWWRNDQTTPTLKTTRIIIILYGTDKKRKNDAKIINVEHTASADLYRVANVKEARVILNVIQSDRYLKLSERC